MSNYIFILGREHELSLAELYAYYPDAAIAEAGDDFIILDLPAEFTQQDLNRLGGTIKVARSIKSIENFALIPALTEILKTHYAGRQLNYGISVYGWPENNLRALLKNLKKGLKEAAVKSRFANQGFLNISSAQYKGLKKDGIELIIAKSGSQFLIGEVVAVQDIDFYSERDYGKPYRDMKVGMLPPKVAQVLINLTGLKQGTIWDPFCGGGTVLMEGLLMGFKVIGSDIDARVLDGGKKNVEWIKTIIRTPDADVAGTVDLFIHDARQPLKNKFFDAIVCEGYLGPPQGRRLSGAQLGPLLGGLEKLYVDFFEALKATHFKGSIVIAMPFFRTPEGQEVFLDGAIIKIKEIGFHPTPLLPKSFASHEILRLTYSRPDQIVGRAIYKMRGA